MSAEGIQRLPSLKPKIADSLWFNPDKPCDDEEELTRQELEHQTWLGSIAQKDNDVIPIGKTASEPFDDEEDEEEDDDDNDDDDSESNDDDDDELDADDIHYESRDSPIDVNFNV